MSTLSTAVREISNETVSKGWKFNLCCIIAWIITWIYIAPFLWRVWRVSTHYILPLNGKNDQLTAHMWLMVTLQPSVYEASFYNWLSSLFNCFANGWNMWCHYVMRDVHVEPHSHRKQRMEVLGLSGRGHLCIGLMTWVWCLDPTMEREGTDSLWSPNVHSCSTCIHTHE